MHVRQSSLDRKRKETLCALYKEGNNLARRKSYLIDLCTPGFYAAHVRYARWLPTPCNNTIFGNYQKRIDHPTGEIHYVFLVYFICREMPDV
jgi:hypothetical protein